MTSTPLPDVAAPSIGPLLSIRRVERLLAATPVVAIGEIRCTPSDPEFAGCDRLQNYFIGFPRSVCRLQRDDGPSYVSTSMVAPLFNVGSGYRRWAVDRAPENSMWIVLGEDTLRDIVEEFDPASVHKAGDSLFRFSAIPLARGCFEEAMAIHACTRRPFDPFELEERALSLAIATLKIGYTPYDAVPGARRRRSTETRHYRIVEGAKAFVAANLSQRLSLSDIGRAAGASPFHLSRVFRAHCGRTISEYANELRVRMAVSLLEDFDLDLTTMAYQLGFASLSHFSSSFKRHLSESPQAYQSSLLRGGPWRVRAAGRPPLPVPIQGAAQ